MSANENPSEPVEVPKEDVRVEEATPPGKRDVFSNVIGAVGAIASAVEAAADVPEKFGAQEAAAKMRVGAAAARSVAEDAARVASHGRQAVAQAADAVAGAKEALGEAKKFFDKLPPMKVQERPSLTRTRRKP